MCGICGLFDNKKVSIDEKTRLITEMNRVQKHRGPDDDGVYADENAALGHVRLSIIDLSSAGHQPMFYGDRYVMVFNGEIYNYIELREELGKKGYGFSSNTDSEVIMAAYDAWGEKCLERFNGFWAFAIYDKVRQHLFLSRDRYGVKPLYYAVQPYGLVFASEIKTLLADKNIKRVANDKAVLDYLVNNFVDCEDETFFKDIYRLPAASYMNVGSDGSFKIEKFYSVQYEEKLEGKFDDTVVKEFRNLFTDSIKMRLRSDVPVGSCLSGGLDSSSIVTESSRQLKGTAFAGNQSVYSACYKDSPEDESKFIDMVIKETGVKGNTIYPTGETLFNDLDHLVYSQDEPFLSTSMYASYCVMKLAHENGAKVLLDGQGADELLCGYRKARVYYIKKLLKAGKIARAAKEIWLYLPYMRKSNSSLAADMRLILQFLGKKKAGANDKRRMYLSEGFKNAEAANTYTSHDRYLIDDFERISLPALLRYVDRNSMAFSIEDRLPFLDYRLVDFGMKLPLNAKMHDGYSKYIMRRALRMPEKIRTRKDKIGFYTPESDWIKQYSSEYRSIFEKQDFRAAKYINNKKIAADWDNIVNDKNEIGLFRYICLEKWMEIFEVTA
ncbi:MAG: asparagine synthase (glutamine-hydrolyzing) [Eubacteriales bacterium]|nr:asparagine synthase (glutamine-hydrolyzing) [Eubacteriales bacterium]